MADDKHYVPGDFYRICDRTGFKIRANKTRKEWTGRIVRDQSWEPRQPQDFVTGVRDDQTVWDPRPRSVDAYQGDLFSTVIASAPIAAVQVSINNTARMFAGDAIGIMLDNGVLFNTTIDAVLNPTDLIIGGPLPWTTSNGLFFINYSAVSAPYIG